MRCPAARSSGSQGSATVAPVAAVLLSGCASGSSSFGEVFFDDFLGERLSDRWRPYDSVPASDSRMRWTPDLVAVRDSHLTLSATWDGTSVAGAVTNWPVTRTFGRWEARIRAYPSPVFSYHVLLWPADDRWPPELDIAEGFDGTRSRTESFVHYRESDGSTAKEGYRLEVDATRWHTVGVDWMPDSVRFTCNGHTVGGTTGAAVPHQPMWLGIQVESHAGEGTDVTVDTPTPVLDVDWVRVSAPTSADSMDDSTEERQ